MLRRVVAAKCNFADANRIKIVSVKMAKIALMQLSACHLDMEKLNRRKE